MKRNILLAAFAGVAGMVSQPEAQAVMTAGSTDVFIGFHQTDNNVDYLVNIGPVSTYIDATAPIVLNIGTTGTILNSTFPGWFTDATVSWGIVGTNEAFTPILYSSVARTNAGTVAPPSPLAPSASVQRTTGTAVKNLKTDFRNYGSPASGTTVGTLQDIAALDFAYADFTSSTPNFGLWPNIEGTMGASSPKILDFYQYTTTTATLIGSFAIDSGGTITFTPVPEPGALGLVALGLAGLVVRRRRGSVPQPAAP